MAYHDDIGQFGRGNIDLYNRPQYRNADGSISTVRSMSANIDGQEVLLPTVSRDAVGNPILLTDEQAIQRYKDTGEHLGKFNTIDEANNYAEALHNQQQRYYLPSNDVQVFTNGKFNNGVQPNNIFVQPQVQQQTKPVVEQTPAPVVQNTKPQPSGNTKVVTAPMDANSPTAGMDYLNSLYTSPEQEEKLRKASVMNQRILAIGDAIRHIGNIANTVNYAPAQQFNSPVAEEQARYERGKALRDRANQQFYTYQQAKAAQDAKMKQLEADRKQKADQWNATFKYNAARDAARLKNAENQWKASLSYRAQNDEANRKQKQKQYDTSNALRRQSIGIQAQNSRNAENYRQWKMKNGGGGGKGGALTIRGANGFLTKRMSAQEANAFYNQAFEELSKMRGANGKPIIDKNAVSGNVLPGIFGGNKINMQARKEAVDKAIYQHPEAGQFLVNQFEFELDPRGMQQTATNQSSSGFKLGRDYWNSLQPQGGYGSTYSPDAVEDDDWEEYAEGVDDEWEDYVEN